MNNYISDRICVLSDISLPDISATISVYDYIKSIKEIRKNEFTGMGCQYNEISYTNIISQFVKLSTDDRCCALCRFWRENKVQKNSDDLNRLPVSVLALPNEGAEKVTALVNIYRNGYCMKANGSQPIQEKRTIDVCNDFVDSRDENSLSCCSFIASISPKERFLNSMRTIRFLFELDKIYYNGILKKLDRLIESPNCSENEKAILRKYTKRIRNHINTSSTFRRISEITSVSSDVIRNQIIRGTKKRFYPKLIFAISEYFKVSPEKLCGCRLGSPKNYHIYEELGLMKELKLESASNIYPNTLIPSIQRSPIIPDEYFIYIVTVLLDICSEEEVDKVLSFYENYKPKSRAVSKSRNATASPIPEREHINQLRGNNTVPDIAAASGLSQKDIEHIMEGKSKLAGIRLYDISSSLSLEPDLFTDDQIVPEPRPAMNPFIHLNDQEHAELRLRRICEAHIDSVLHQMYNLYPDFTKRIMKLYMAYGIDRIRSEYINNEQKLIAYLKHNHPAEFSAICGEELFDANYY